MPFRSRWLDDVLLDNAVPDLRDAVWFQLAGELSEMRHDNAFRWADELLAKIQDEVERSHAVSARQLRTIARIRGSEWSPARSYDSAGYRRRWR